MVLRFEAIAKRTPQLFHDRIAQQLIDDATGLFLVAQWLGHPTPLECVKRGSMVFPTLLHGEKRSVFVSVMGRMQVFRKCFLFHDKEGAALPGTLGILIARSDPKSDKFHLLGYTHSSVGWTQAKRRVFQARRKSVWSIGESQMSSMAQLEAHRIGGTLEMAV